MPSHNSNKNHQLFSSKSLFSLFSVLTVLMLSVSIQAGPNGRPFKKIFEEIERLDTEIQQLTSGLDSINSQIEEINNTLNDQLLSNLPVSADVDCSNGESIAGVISEYANSVATLTINISGVCQETVFVLRDNVHLNGVSTDASISNLSDVYGAVTVSSGARNVRVQNLSLSGPRFGLLATKNSQVVATNVSISGSIYGAIAIDNAVIDITGSTLNTNTVGLIAIRNSVITTSGTNVINNNTGAVATTGGLVNLITNAPDGSASTPVIFEGNNVGLNATTGGKLGMTSVNVSGGAVGVLLSPTGIAQINNSIISNATSIGVLVQKSAAAFFNNTNEFIGNQIAISCTPSSTYVVSGAPGSLPGTFSGNIVDINACVP